MIFFLFFTLIIFSVKTEITDHSAITQIKERFFSLLEVKKSIYFIPSTGKKLLLIGFGHMS